MVKKYADDSFIKIDLHKLISDLKEM